MELVGTLGIVGTSIELGLAGVVEGGVDALVDGCGVGGGEAEDYHCQREDIFH